ncbi:MAG: HEPN domain-containing protein, partial [Candidatus Micrarchaeota archaeon]
DSNQIRNLLGIAKRDLEVAEHLLSVNSDASFMHSYNAILQSARALMFSKGYRPVEDEHKTTIDFIGAVFPNVGYLAILDRMRRKRHVVTYDEANKTSEYEAKHALKTAKEFLNFAKSKISIS